MSRAGWDNEAVVEQLRTWLEQTSGEVDASSHFDGDGETESEPSPPQVGLLQVVEALTAMRHELKLETKSTRNLQEAVGSAVEGMEQAARRFESVQAREQEAARRAAGDMAEALVSLDESLMRAERAFTSARNRLIEFVPDSLREQVDQLYRNLPWWRRMLWRRRRRAMRDFIVEALRNLNVEESGRLVEGFSLIQARMARALDDLEIQRIPCVGRRVDPALMTVVELVDDPESEAETVVEEVRPGYTWRGDVVRYAEVRAVGR